MQDERDFANAYTQFSPADAAGADRVGPAQEGVVAQVPSGQDHSINLRFVRGTEFIDARPRICRPRGDVPQSGFDSVRSTVAVLPSALLARLRQANNQVMTWLAASERNAGLFMANPTAALREAGVELSRAEVKAIGRAREDLSGDAVVPPGARLRAVGARAYPRGEVGKIGRTGATGGTDASGTGAARRPGTKKRGCVKE